MLKQVNYRKRVVKEQNDESERNPGEIPLFI